MELKYMGCHYTESRSMIIHRPQGSGDWLFLLFHSDIYIEHQHTIQLYPPGTCILYSPDAPQHYNHPFHGFDNDWLHLKGDDCSAYINALDLPINTPLQLNGSDILHQHIQKIEKEQLMLYIDRPQMLDLLLKELIILTSRIYHSTLDEAKNNNTHQSLRQLRSEILSQLERHWTVKDMAELAGLSRSRFSYLYKETFAISPKEDLLTERMNMAKHLLKSQNQPISEIAARVGYDNVYHFSKQFKLNYALSPSQYRSTD